MKTHESTVSPLEAKWAKEEEVANKRRVIEEIEQARLDELIPVPVGWSILIAIPQPEEEFRGKILKAAETKRAEHILSSIGLVIDVGPQAYNDKDRFGDIPWCKPGDYVMFRPNSGTRFKMGNKELRLLNDDSVEALVPDPSAIADAR